MHVCGSSVTIRSIHADELSAVLDVYRQCEDFLALGPQPNASLPMVLDDLAHSQAEGGVYCGIYDRRGRMVGVVDVVLQGFEQHPQQAFISLLMIALPHRRQGIGAAVVALVENEIRRHPEVTEILSGVQTNNPAAIQFWQRNGYRIVGGPDEMPDRTIVYRLRKGIDP